MPNHDFKPDPKRKGRNQYVGSWSETECRLIPLPFRPESMGQVLAWGAYPETAPYTHQEIAHWCDRMFMKFLDTDEEPAMEAAIRIASAVDCQWDLFLANAYNLDQLRQLDFSTVKLPREWFVDWQKEFDRIEPGMFEMVHTMTDFYDGPRCGIADFHGKPHIYRSLWMDEDYHDTFFLTPVKAEIFDLAIEDWNIWLRWESAFHAGKTSQATHPALSEDRKRHDELKVLLDQALQINEATALKATAKFRARKDLDWSGKGFRPLEVCWTVVTHPKGGLASKE